MDKVECVGFVQPFVFEVLDNELDIWGNPVRLDGTNVIPNDACLGEFPLLRLIFHNHFPNTWIQGAVYSAMSRAQIPVPVPRSRIF